MSAMVNTFGIAYGDDGVFTGAGRRGICRSFTASATLARELEEAAKAKDMGWTRLSREVGRG